MVVGALKDYIESELDITRKNKNCVGREVYNIFKDKFDDNVLAVLKEVKIPVLHKENWLGNNCFIWKSII